MDCNNCPVAILRCNESTAEEGQPADAAWSPSWASALAAASRTPASCNKGVPPLRQQTHLAQRWYKGRVSNCSGLRTRASTEVQKFLQEPPHQQLKLVALDCSNCPVAIPRCNETTADEGQQADAAWSSSWASALAAASRTLASEARHAHLQVQLQIGKPHFTAQMPR